MPTPSRGAIERFLGRFGFEMEQRACVWSNKPCRWFVHERLDPYNHAGFQTLADVYDWALEREDGNAGLPYNGRPEPKPKPKRGPGRPRKPDAMTQAERDARRMAGAMMMRLPARVAQKVRALQKRDGDATLIDVVERAVEKALG